MAAPTFGNGRKAIVSIWIYCITGFAVLKFGDRRDTPVVNIYNNNLDLLVTHIDSNRAEKYGTLKDFHAFMLADKSIITIDNIQKSYSNMLSGPKDYKYTQLGRWFFPDIYKLVPIASVAEATLNNSKVFPNPAKEELVIQLDDYFKSFKLEVLNITGERVEAAIKSVSENSITLDLSQHCVGVFFYTLVTCKKTFIGKFVKE